MTHEPYDWAGALAEEPGHAYAHAAETAFDELMSRGGVSAEALAAIGVGYAVLALRETVASVGTDVSNSVADVATELYAVRPVERAPWWRRLLDRFAGRADEGQADAGDDGQEHEHQAAEPKGRRRTLPEGWGVVS